MINWLLVLMLPLGVLAGTELKHRRRQAAGETCSFLPVWTHRALTYAGVAGMVLFAEAARVAWDDPSQETVFTMILAALLAFVSMTERSDRELRAAKLELARAAGQDAQRAR